ncbi:MAG: uroporphyrinogen decarboxylase family protein [bacterium]|jgi:hypothetical protein
MTSHPVDISLNFMPAFFRKHLGVTYGDAFYFDPGHRANVERAESRFLYEVLGRFGVGSPTPSPSPSLFIQPIDLLKATQGTPVCCPLDATLETRGHAWADLSVAEIERLDPRAAAHHPFVDTLLGQYHELQRLYGDQADLFGLKSGMMNLHAPFTTAHQLCGETLFYLLVDDPKGARLIFDKIWALYQAVFARLRAEIGAPPLSRVNLGDCSASLISAEQYREVVLPANQAIAAKFTRANYHSCGSSSHLLEAFADIPGVKSIELGPGTNLPLAVRHLPGVAMRPLVDPLVMRNASPDAICALTRVMVTDCAPAPATTLCAWSFDRDTPIANVEAMYSAVKELTP